MRIALAMVLALGCSGNRPTTTETPPAARQSKHPVNKEILDPATPVFAEAELIPQELGEFPLPLGCDRFEVTFSIPDPLIPRVTVNHDTQEQYPGWEQSRMLYVEGELASHPDIPFPLAEDDPLALIQLRPDEQTAFQDLLATVAQWWGMSSPTHCKGAPVRSGNHAMGGQHSIMRNIALGCIDHGGSFTADEIDSALRFAYNRWGDASVKVRCTGLAEEFLAYPFTSGHLSALP